MKFILSPDSFKDSMSAQKVTQVMKKAILYIDAEAEIVELPVGDGGEGTLTILTYAAQGKLIDTTVTGPLGEPVKAQSESREMEQRPLWKWHRRAACN